MRTISIALVFVALGLGLTGPASADQAVERPYKGTERGLSTVDFGACEGGEGTLTCAVSTVSTANITHVGRADVTSEGRITLFFTEPCLLLDGVTSGLVFRSTGAAEIIAANGDSIYETYSNQGCAQLDDGEPIGTALVGSQQITGGTGRFEGATGSTTVDAVAFGDFFDLSFQGTITY